MRIFGASHKRKPLPRQQDWLTPPKAPFRVTHRLPRMKIGLLSRFGPAQIACLRSWRRSGHQVAFAHVLETGPLHHTPHMLGGYLPVSAHAAHNGAGDAALAAFFADADIITGLSYPEIARLHALKAAHRLKAVVAGPVPDLLPFLDAKAPQIALAEQVGLSCLPTWTIRSEADIGAVPSEAFPIVLRPDRPDSATPEFKAERITDRAALIRRTAELAPGYVLVAQPFLNAPNLVVHGARAFNGSAPQPAAFLADWKYRGVTQRLMPVPLDPALAQRCRDFAGAAGLTGVYHFEFLAPAGGEPVFLEVNGRLGGTTAKVLPCGWDEPAHLLASTGHGPWPAYQPRDTKVTNRLSLGRRLKDLALHGDDPLDYPAASRLRVAAGLAAGFAAWEDEVIDLADWRTTLDFYRMRFL